MLSIGSIKSASGAAEYYARDNYYTRELQEDASEWFGKGAHALGLEGAVEAARFEDILSGKLPDGTEIAHSAKGHRCGFDLTFSASKSVSLMALVGGDTRLIDAHRDAVRATLSWAERNFAAARLGKDGRETVTTGNLVIALFHHDTSRAKDPLLHSHSVIANVTQRPDDAWRALKNDQLYQENKLIGALYHNELRSRVTALGYPIESSGKNGMFEIAGFTRETIEAWSKRSVEINAIAERIGKTSPQAKGEIALRTRGGKEDIAPAELRAAWQQMAEARGENFAGMIAAPMEQKTERGLLDTVRAWGEALLDRVMAFWRPKPEPLVGNAARLRTVETTAAAYAVASAVRHLGERDATFRPNDVLREALNFAAERSGIGAIEARVHRLLDKGELIAGQGGGASRLTTPDMLDTEKAIVALARAGRGQIAAGPGEEMANERIQAAAKGRLGFALRDEQLEAAKAILYGQDKVVLVQGDSGTGKSTIFAAINAVPESDRPNLAMLTTQSSLARDLQRDSGIDTRTLAHLLTKHEPLAATNRAARPEDKALWQGKTLIIDEASMVSSRQMLGLFKIANKLGIERIALVGDAKQIPAIEAGRPFALLQEKLRPLALSQNVRQRDPDMRAAVERLGAGDVRGAFALLDSRIIETADPSKAAAQAWLKLDAGQRDVTAVYTSGHRLRGQVLDALADGQGRDRPSITLSVFENLNRTREEMRHTKNYASGMQLDLHRNQPAIGLDKGSYKIISVDQTKWAVTVERDGRQVAIQPHKLHPNAAGLSLSVPKEITVREGDKLMASQNQPRRDITNGDQFTLKAIENDRLRLEGREGRETLIEASDPMRARLDHAGALNMHRVQGQTVENAITVLSSNDRLLNSQSLAYVLASRARDGFTLFLDDKSKVIEQIERNNGTRHHATELADEPGKTSVRSQLPPVGLPAEMLAKIEGAKENDKVNSLPVPERKLGLDLM